MIENTFATENNPLLAQPPTTVNPSIIEGIITSNARATPTAVASSFNPAVAAFPRPRQRRPAQPALLLEVPPGTPSFQAIFAIISKYFKSRGVCISISNRLAALSESETIHLNDLITSTSSRYRPNKEEILLMIEEFNSTNVLNVSSLSHRRILFKKP